MSHSRQKKCSTITKFGSENRTEKGLTLSIILKWFTNRREGCKLGVALLNAT